LVAIVGEEALSDRDKKLLKFAEEFEAQFVTQDRREDREIIKSLGLGWELLSKIPKRMLTRISPELKNKFWKGKEE
jgi:V/A-type H+-transporting ATPase subunit B